jgi:hypothetical protein
MDMESQDDSEGAVESKRIVTTSSGSDAIFGSLSPLHEGHTVDVSISTESQEFTWANAQFDEIKSMATTTLLESKEDADILISDTSTTSGSQTVQIVTPIVTVGFVANGKQLHKLTRKYKSDTQLAAIVQDLLNDEPVRGYQSAHVPSFLKCRDDEFFRRRGWLIGMDMAIASRLCDWSHLRLDWTRIELSDDVFSRACDQLIVAFECFKAGLYWPLWRHQDREHLTRCPFGEWSADSMQDTSMSELMLVETTDECRARQSKNADKTMFWIVHKARYQAALADLLYRNTDAKQAASNVLREPISQTVLTRAQLQKLEETVSLFARPGNELRLPAVKPDTGVCNLRYSEALMLCLHKMR